MAIYNDPGHIKARVKEVCGRPIYGRVEIIEDASEYMSIHGGMILRLTGNDYFITGDATEGRFGIDDQPKFWVKYAYDLETGRRKIIKLVFYEEFTTRVGPFLIRANRSPEKESRVLKVVAGDDRFMQGVSTTDTANNLIRVIDFVPGKSFYRTLNELKISHEEYFHDRLPDVLAHLTEAFKAIGRLVAAGEQHGDIRCDHLLIEPESGRYVWIDFDYQVSHGDYDIWSLGNVLAFAVGMGAHTFHSIALNPQLYPVDITKIDLNPDDRLLVSQNQAANLKKLFPYIPDRLNNMLLNFSWGTDKFYETVSEITDDLEQAREDL